MGRRSAQIPSMVYFKKNYKSPSYLYQKYYEMSIFLNMEWQFFLRKAQLFTFHAFVPQAKGDTWISSAAALEALPDSAFSMI